MRDSAPPTAGKARRSADTRTVEMAYGDARATPDVLRGRKTPALVDRALPNGLRLLVLRHGSTPLAEARLVVPMPCRTRADLAGSMLLSAMAPLRNRTDDGVEVGATSDAHQMTITAYSSMDGVNALVSAIRGVARGTAGDLEAARDQLIAHIRMARAHPDVAVRAGLARHLFGDHPAAFQLPGESEVADVAKLRLPALDPRGAVLVMLAPDDPERLAGLAEKALADWRPPVHRPAPLPLLPLVEGGRLALLPQPGAPQSRIRLRAQAVPTDHDSYPALFLAGNVLGGYLSSRLFRTLREKNGYVYSVTAFFETHPGTGLLAIEADTATATTEAALEALFLELGRMRTHPPTPQEIRAARTYALGSTTTRLAPRASLASALAALAAKNVDPLSLFDFPRRLTTISPDAVASAAAEFLAPERFSGLIAADPDRGTSPLITSAPGQSANWSPRLFLKSAHSTETSARDATASLPPLPSPQEDGSEGSGALTRRT